MLREVREDAMDDYEPFETEVAGKKVLMRRARPEELRPEEIEAMEKSKALAAASAARRPLQLDRQGNMIFQDAAELARFARRMLESGVMPKHIDSPQRFELMYLRLTKLGVHALSALQHTYVNTKSGQIDIWGPLGLAACMNHPEFEDCTEYLINEKGEQETDANCLTFEAHAAVCIVKRKGREPKVARFTRKRAQAAQLLGKQGTWQNYQFRMLKARARGYALFDAFPDVLEGVAMDGIGADAPREEPEQNVVEVQHGKAGEPDTFYRTRHDPSRDKAKQISARFAQKTPHVIPPEEIEEVRQTLAGNAPAKGVAQRKSWPVKPEPEPEDEPELVEALDEPELVEPAHLREDDEEDYQQRIRKFVQPEEVDNGQD